MQVCFPWVAGSTNAGGPSLAKRAVHSPGSSGSIGARLGSRWAVHAGISPPRLARSLLGRQIHLIPPTAGGPPLVGSSLLPAPHLFLPHSHAPHPVLQHASRPCRQWHLTSPHPHPLDPTPLPHSTLTPSSGMRPNHAMGGALSRRPPYPTSPHPAIRHASQNAKAM